MTVLAIIETNITDPTWIEDYVKNVTPIVTNAGGKYLTRSDNVDLIEGSEKPQFSVVAEFPSKEAALKLYNSEEYKPYKIARQSGSTSKYLIVEVENGTE